MTSEASITHESNWRTLYHSSPCVILPAQKCQNAFCFDRTTVRNLLEVGLSMTTLYDGSGEPVPRVSLLDPISSCVVPRTDLSELWSPPSRNGGWYTYMGDLGGFEQIDSRFVIEEQGMRTQGLKPRLIEASAMVGAQGFVPLVKVVGSQVPRRSCYVVPWFGWLRAAPFIHVPSPI